MKKRDIEKYARFGKETPIPGSSFKSMDDGIFDYPLELLDFEDKPALTMYMSEIYWRDRLIPDLSDGEEVSELIEELEKVLDSSGYRDFLSAFEELSAIYVSGERPDTGLIERFKNVLHSCKEPLGYSAYQSISLLGKIAEGDESPSVMFTAGYCYAKTMALKKRTLAIRGIQFDPRKAGSRGRKRGSFDLKDEVIDAWELFKKDGGKSKQDFYNHLVQNRRSYDLRITRSDGQPFIQLAGVQRSWNTIRAWLK
jgi:hypothetical protein